MIWWHMCSDKSLYQIYKNTIPNYTITWWTIPDPGGTINMFRNALAPH